jgi:8-oxo-dGTP pyrophosphatase MutT (NUDIX family)
VIVRSVAVTVCEGQVLLVASNSTPGAWVPPGGKLERHEALPEAAAREVLEETGVEVRALWLTAYREVWGAAGDGLELYFAAETVVGTPTPPDGGVEGRAAQWVPLAGLAQVLHFPADLGALCRRVTAGEREALRLAPRDLRGGAAR